MDPTTDETGASAVAEAPGTADGDSILSPETGAPTPENDSPAIAPEGFRLEDVPEEYRDHVAALERQFKSAFTRARQADSERLSDAQAALEMAEALNDPEQALELLNEIADRHGYGRGDEDDQGGQVEGQAPPAELPPELAETLSTVEELRQAEELRQQERRVSLVREHVEAGIRDAFGESDPSSDQRELVTWAALSNPSQDGLPNIERAVELVQAVEAAAVDRVLRSKTGQPGAPDASGTTGISQVDTSTEEGRLKAAAAIAARHLDAS